MRMQVRKVHGSRKKGFFEKVGDVVEDAVAGRDTSLSGAVDYLMNEQVTLTLTLALT